MRNFNVDPEASSLFSELLADTSEDHLVNEDEPDTFLKTLADIEYDVDRATLDVELANVHESIDGYYQKLARDAAPPAEVTADPQRLAKQFSQPDAKSAYRQYFRDRLAKGQSADAALAEWRRTFEHVNPDVELLMVEVAKEFR